MFLISVISCEKSWAPESCCAVFKGNKKLKGRHTESLSSPGIMYMQRGHMVLPTHMGSRVQDSWFRVETRRACGITTGYTGMLSS
jgi:hypothetical protein